MNGPENGIGDPDVAFIFPVEGADEEEFRWVARVLLQLLVNIKGPQDEPLIVPRPPIRCF